MNIKHLYYTTVSVAYSCQGCRLSFWYNRLIWRSRCVICEVWCGIKLSRLFTFCCQYSHPYLLMGSLLMLIGPNHSELWWTNSIEYLIILNKICQHTFHVQNISCNTNTKTRWFTTTTALHYQNQNVQMHNMNYNIKMDNGQVHNIKCSILEKCLGKVCKHSSLWQCTTATSLHQIT